MSCGIKVGLLSVCYFLGVGLIAMLIVLLCMLSLYITCAFCGLFWLFAIALLWVVC